MATVAAIATVVAAGASVAGSIQQRRQQKKVAREQRRQNEIQNRLARSARARDVRRQIASNRVRQAQLQAAGFSFGVPGATSVQQAVGATTTDVATSIGAGQQQLSTAELIAQSQNRIAGITGQFNPFAAIQSVAGAATNPQVNRAVAGTFNFGTPTVTPPTGTIARNTPVGV